MQDKNIKYIAGLIIGKFKVKHFYLEDTYTTDTDD